MLVQAIFKFASARSSTSHVKLIRICEKDSVIVQHLVDSLMEVTNAKGTTGGSTNLDDVGLVYQWSWMEDLKAQSWKPFDPNENFQIELGMTTIFTIACAPTNYTLAYLSQGQKGKMITTVTGDLNQVKNGFTYEIDFDAMTEVNTKYRATLRPIKREPVKHTANFAWEIQAGEKGEWIKFGLLENKQVSSYSFVTKKHLNTSPFLSV